MDVDKFIESILANHITEYDLNVLFRQAMEVLYSEGTILNVSSPIVVCGDVHGQFFDVLQLFRVGGDPKDVKYLFLGDYVDRGFFSIETISLLLAYKIKYPNNFILLRGNHETRPINTTYGFYEEVIAKFGHASIWELCNQVFEMLPMAALIDNKIFCVHGGLSPAIRLVESIALLQKLPNIFFDGPISDLCWSDPGEESLQGWAVNNPRGAGWYFGSVAAEEFCHNNRLNFIARAHQLVLEGFQWHFNNRVATVWSAPNYMYRTKNLASIMQVNQNLEVNFKIFEAVPDENRVLPEQIVPKYFE